MANGNEKVEIIKMSKSRVAIKEKITEIKYRKSISIALLVIVILGFYYVFRVNEEELRGMLVTVSELGVVISIGIGALTVSYSKNRKIQAKLAEFTIAIIVLSLLTLLVANIELNLNDFLDISILKVYFIVNIVGLCFFLFSTLLVIKNDSK